jgi:hypothetical protein
VARTRAPHVRAPMAEEKLPKRLYLPPPRHAWPRQSAPLPHLRRRGSSQLTKILPRWAQAMAGSGLIGSVTPQGIDGGASSSFLSARPFGMQLSSPRTLHDFWSAAHGHCARTIQHRGLTRQRRACAPSRE